MQYKVSTRTEFRGRSNFSPRKNNVFVARKKRAGSGAGKRSSFFKKIKPINPSSSRKRETFFQLAVIQPLCQTYIGLFLKQKKKKKKRKKNPIVPLGAQFVVDETSNDTSFKTICANNNYIATRLTKK